MIFLLYGIKFIAIKPHYFIDEMLYDSIAVLAIILLSVAIIWCLAFLVYYFYSPFVFWYTIRSARANQLYSIYSNIKPEDKRSRAIYCLIDSSALAIFALILFTAYVMSRHMVDLPFTIASNKYFFILVAMMILLGLSRNYLIVKLANIGVIKSVGPNRELPDNYTRDPLKIRYK